MIEVVPALDELRGIGSMRAASGNGVLHVIPSLLVGGAEWMAAELMVELTASFPPTVVTLGSSSGSPIEAFLHERQVRVEHLAKGRGPSPRAAVALWSLARRLRPSVIHTHLYALKYALPAGRLLGIPIVHTIHTVAGTEVRRLDRLVHRLAFRGAASPVAIAHAVEESFRAEYGMAPAARIPNGVRTASFAAASGDRFRAERGIAPDELLVVCVGRLAAPKNHALLLRAFARVGPALGARLLLVGDGPLRGELGALVEELGLAGRVELLGMRSDIPEILAASDVFALASNWEGNPLSVMEAMAAGLPVVATDVGGVGELVRHDETGLVVPAGDVDRFAEALATLLASEAQRDRFGRAGARLASESFDITAMGRRYAELYREVARRR